MFGKLKEMARSLGLPSLEFIDDRGVTVQMEIRPPSSSDYNVPHCGYRTHLMRLLVNKSLHFFLEVLGQRVSTGSFLSDQSIDPHIVDNVLDTLNGGVHVCQGRGTVPPELTETSRRKEAVRKCLVDGNIITYPDYRYRSLDCHFLVDAQNGATQCSPCAQNDGCRRESLPNTLDFSNLRLDNNQDANDDKLEPILVEHHHHHHHHYYKDGSSPISFLYQDPDGPAPMSLTIE